MSLDQGPSDPPRRRLDCATLFTDRHGAVVIVRHPHHDAYTLPTGTADAEEEPHRAAMRGVRTTLGLDLSVGRLLVVDYVPFRRDTAQPGRMLYVFDGGVLADEHIALIKRGQTFALVHLGDLAPFADAGDVRRIRAAAAAVSTKQTVYLVGGHPPAPRSGAHPLAASR
ncbi:NUDIX domain-containing protein [Allostreptomyces psammosilenae]|uniref:ADP-ribose pyrophosphatase YjhB (NUDIX family) n=1 Tax=Allostreptomyces psammosilenae TaxID=1892865 RepID=A0A852ZXH8_9ACTN|nr:NUDIX domain-containing protein [Allostreptomyces psammosilenae]NYI06899.1 ADP-ribose pyrophosphatase YjhB (NUDIX family) [Allostreptomyces psammosilenae]